MNPVTRQTPLALLGLGAMGSPMAKNLLASWGAITVWNRTASRAEELRSWGAYIATSPRDAAREVTLTVLQDLPTVESVLAGPEGLLAGWKENGIPNPILVVHGTSSPIAISDLASTLLDRHAVRVIDAPLSGGVVSAERAILDITMSGDESTARSLYPLLAHLGRSVRYLGPSGCGSLGNACAENEEGRAISALTESALFPSDQHHPKVNGLVDRCGRRPEGHHLFLLQVVGMPIAVSELRLEHPE